MLGTPQTPRGISQVWSREQNPLPRAAAHTAFDAAQDPLGFLGSKCTLPIPVQSLSHQHPQVLLGEAVLDSFIPQPLLIQGFALTQV